MRLTIGKEILDWYIEPKLVFYNNDVEFCRLNPSIVEDLKCWAGMTEDEAILEVTQLLKNALNDPTLDYEIELLIKQIRDERKK